MFECLVLVHLGGFTEHIGVLPTTQFAYRKGQGICDSLLCVSHTLQSALTSGQEAISPPPMTWGGSEFSRKSVVRGD